MRIANIYTKGKTFNFQYFKSIETITAVNYFDEAENIIAILYKKSGKLSMTTSFTVNGMTPTEYSRTQEKKRQAEKVLKTAEKIAKSFEEQPETKARRIAQLVKRMNTGNKKIVIASDTPTMKHLKIILDEMKVDAITLKDYQEQEKNRYFIRKLTEAVKALNDTQCKASGVGSFRDYIEKVGSLPKYRKGSQSGPAIVGDIKRPEPIQDASGQIHEKLMNQGTEHLNRIIDILVTSEYRERVGNYVRQLKKINVKPEDFKIEHNGEKVSARFIKNYGDGYVSINWYGFLKGRKYSGPGYYNESGRAVRNSGLYITSESHYKNVFK